MFFVSCNGLCSPKTWEKYYGAGAQSDGTSLLGTARRGSDLNKPRCKTLSLTLIAFSVSPSAGTPNSWLPKGWLFRLCSSDLQPGNSSKEINVDWWLRDSNHSGSQRISQRMQAGAMGAPEPSAFAYFATASNQLLSNLRSGARSIFSYSRIFSCPRGKQPDEKLFLGLIEMLQIEFPSRVSSGNLRPAPITTRYSLWLLSTQRWM